MEGRINAVTFELPFKTLGPSLVCSHHFFESLSKKYDSRRCFSLCSKIRSPFLQAFFFCVVQGDLCVSKRLRDNLSRRRDAAFLQICNVIGLRTLLI